MLLETESMPTAGPASWTGRTRLATSREELREALYRSTEDETRWFGALQLLRGLDEATGLPPAALDGFSLDNPEQVARLGGFSGWKRRSPPHPQRTPPLPLDLRLPVGVSVPPLDLLLPWWHELAAGTRGVAPLAWFHGVRLAFEPWERARVEWSLDDLAHLCAGSSLTVYPDSVELTANYTEWDSAVRGPGRVGRFVPVYSEVRSLLSTATRRLQSLVVGCRIRLEWIRAVSFSQNFFVSRPLLAGRKERDLAVERGYGQLRRTEIAIEVDDGWRPSLLRLSGDYVPPEREEQPKELAVWLVTMLAGRRASQGALTQDEHDWLAYLASRGPTMYETRGSDHYRRWFRCEIAGAQPISVVLPGT